MSIESFTETSVGRIECVYEVQLSVWDNAEWTSPSQPLRAGNRVCTSVTGNVQGLALPRSLKHVLYIRSRDCDSQKTRNQVVQFDQSVDGCPFDLEAGRYLLTIKVDGGQGFQPGIDFDVLPAEE